MEYPTNLPLEKDIQDSNKHLKDQEATHGEWKYPSDEENVKVKNMAQVESVPACTSIGCKTSSAGVRKVKKGEEIPRDYPVPNFGVDKDIQTSLKHT